MRRNSSPSGRRIGNPQAQIWVFDPVNQASNTNDPLFSLRWIRHIETADCISDQKFPSGGSLPRQLVPSLDFFRGGSSHEFIRVLKGSWDSNQTHSSLAVGVLCYGSCHLCFAGLCGCLNRLANGLE